MQGRFKKNHIIIGDNQVLKIPSNVDIEIIEVQNHPEFGRRYKILGCKGWIKHECFEYVIGYI